MSDLRAYFERKGLTLDPRITELRPHQIAARDWALETRAPYLFINAPTGSGKTLLLGDIGCHMGLTWTYGVHTIRLQEQVAGTFIGLPVLTGRGNWDCEIGVETHGRPIKADVAICTGESYCEYSGPPNEAADEADLERYATHAMLHDEGKVALLCGYYEQRDTATRSPHRVANYAMFLRYARLRQRGATAILLADEAHNIESAVCSATEFSMMASTYKRFGIRLLPANADLGRWIEWAKESLPKVPVPKRGRSSPDIGARIIREQLQQIAKMRPSDEGNWIVVEIDNGLKWQAVWGAPYVMGQLFGHKEPPGLSDYTPGVQRVIMTSATLMGAEFIADMLGLPADSWAYYDMPSTFPPDTRPINYAPVIKMNRDQMATPAGRKPMQDAMDNLIDRYISSEGKISGVIHAVSNKYRDQILTESRWRAILTSDVKVHEEKIARGQSSVVVAANLSEGWDGVDELCRVVIMPKVPYPSLGDERVRRRKDKDSRTFDHAALVAIVQGAGRGVRHKEDHAETWILDESWGFLYSKHKGWLPESFRDAYHHKVRLS